MVQGKVPMPEIPPVRVYGPRDTPPPDLQLIDTTSKGIEWRELSPFFLGPCYLYEGYASERMENAWQYAKVYEEHTDGKGNPTQEYWDWAIEGWSNRRAVRYPMGKGRKPLYSLWDGEKLNYIEARKRIYVPLYARLVTCTETYQRLDQMYINGEAFCLWDYDGYDYLRLGYTLEQVLNNPDRKMGHAFVLAMLLTGFLPDPNRQGIVDKS